MNWLIKADFFLVILVLIFISWRDITTRMIHHNSLLWLTIFLIPLFIFERRLPNFFSALTVFVGCFILFVFHIIGGGDVKLLTLLSLVFSTASLTLFIFTTVIFGGVITLVGLLLFHQNVRIHGVPYGVAIAMAFISIYPATSTLY